MYGLSIYINYIISILYMYELYNLSQKVSPVVLGKIHDAFLYHGETGTYSTNRAKFSRMERRKGKEGILGKEGKGMKER